MELKVSLKEIYELARMQNIFPELEARIECPYCDGEKSKTLVVKLGHKTAYCYNCRKNIGRSDFDAMLTMIKEEALEDRKDMKELMEAQPGFDN